MFFVAWSAQRQSDAEKRAYEQTSLAFAKLFAARLDDQLGDVKSLGTVISHSVQVGPEFIEQNDAFLRRLSGELPAFVIDIGIWDLAGRNVGTLNQSAASRTVNLVERGYLQQPLHSDTWIIEGPIQASSSGVALVQFARALYRPPNHQRVGVLTLAVTLDRLQLAIDSKGAVPANTVTTVVNQAGIVIARSKDFAEWVGRPAPASAKSDLAQLEGSRTGTSLDGGMLFGYANATEAPWKVYVGTPIDQIDGPIHAHARGLLEFGAMLILVAMLGAFFLARALVRPLRVLAGDATRLGEADGTFHSTVAGPPEIATISERLNQAALTLVEREATLRRNKVWLRKVTDSIPLLLSYVDREGYYRFANQHYEPMFGIRPSELIGRHAASTLPAHLAALLLPHAERCLLGKDQRFEYTLTTPRGQRDMLATFLVDVDASGGVEGFFGIHQDITEQKEAQRALQRESALLSLSQERLKTIADNLPALICYINAQWRYEFVNATYFDWMDRLPQDVEGKSVHEIVPDHLWQQLQPRIASALGGETVVYEAEVLSRLGGTRWIHGTYIPHRAADGRVLGVYGMTTDITAEKRIELQLTNLAELDPLTSLANRRKFDAVYAKALRASADEGKSLAVVFVDIDRFKRINDTHGHAAGDWVLKQTAGRLQDVVRQGDFVARISGDEFVILIADLHSQDEALFVARKLLECCKKPIISGEIALRITVSLGIAYHPGGPVAASELLRSADAALYKAKADGRGTFAVAPKALMV